MRPPHPARVVPGAIRRPVIGTLRAVAGAEPVPATGGQDAVTGGFLALRPNVEVHAPPDAVRKATALADLDETQVATEVLLPPSAAVRPGLHDPIACPS